MSVEPQSGTPRDRRRRKRILTKKNVLVTLAVIFVAFIGASIYFEINPPDEGLFERRKVEKVPEIEPQPIRPVTESVPKEEGADPMLLDAARREQYLGTGMYDPLNPDTPVTMTTTDDSTFSVEDEDLPLLERNSDRRTSRISITGTPDGVRIEKKPDQ
ncbi:MAG: hypothetical protein KY459_05905 [Acidobacteria bacterium]|nr:hypothetical protein [Acidobacteriota bacterium]